MDSTPGNRVRLCAGRVSARVDVIESVEMELHGVNIDPQAVADFCTRHGIRKLSLFGSILRDDFGPDSDVDVLVEFDPERMPTLLDMVDMESELSQVIGRKVDLRTPQELSEYFREAVVRTAKVQYAA